MLFWCTSSCGLSVICVRKKGGFSCVQRATSLYDWLIILKYRGQQDIFFYPDEGDAKKIEVLAARRGSRWGWKFNCLHDNYESTSWFRPPALLPLIPPHSLCPSALLRWFTETSEWMELENCSLPCSSIMTIVISIKEALTGIAFYCSQICKDVQSCSAGSAVLRRN